jgi:hypothetical protein
MKEKTDTVIIVFAGSMMIAHGLRMMTQGIFFPDSIYPAPVLSSIDFWFDWFVLCLFGIGIVFIGAKQLKRWMVLEKLKNENEQRTI